jgi:hypothetical protein
LNKILNNYSNSVALDGNPEPEPDLVDATGCKQPSLRFYIISAGGMHRTLDGKTLA